MVDSVIETIIDMYDFMEAIDALKDDEQSIELLNEVYRHFYDKFKLDRSELDAFQRLCAVIENRDKWDPALLRNNIFKAANSLGLELPSYMF